MLGVDGAGLEDMDRKILKALVTNSGPVGLKTLAVAVGKRREQSKRSTEPYLIQNNFLVRTSRGRKATEKAPNILELNPWRMTRSDSSENQESRIKNPSRSHENPSTRNISCRENGTRPHSTGGETMKGPPDGSKDFTQLIVWQKAH
jgi:hypothetical protein